MRSHALFQKDSAERLRAAFARGAVSRRDFLQLSAMLGLTTATMGAGALKAQTSTLTIANYGGDAIATYKEAWLDAFTAETGIPVEVDGSGPLSGRIRAMIESGSVTWDVCDATFYYPGMLGEGNVEPIDYNVVDKSKYFDWNHTDLGAGSYVFSNVLAWDSSKFDEAPQNWADF